MNEFKTIRPEIWNSVKQNSFFTINKTLSVEYYAAIYPFVCDDIMNHVIGIAIKHLRN